MDHWSAHGARPAPTPHEGHEHPHPHRRGPPMMGHAHALSGVTAWLAVSAATPLSVPLTGATEPVPLLVGAAVASGAALLPDLDHHSATATRALPPFTTVISKVTEIRPWRPRLGPRRHHRP